MKICNRELSFETALVNMVVFAFFPPILIFCFGYLMTLFM